MSSILKKHLLIKLKLAIAATCLTLSTTSCEVHRQSYFFSSCPMTLSSINLIDRNGMSETINNSDRLKQYSNVDFLAPQPYQKVLRVFSRDQQGNIASYITSYHSNGYPKQYLEVINSRAFGAYKEWHPNGTQKIEAVVIGGNADIVEGAERTWLFDGCSNVWDENGNLQATIPYTAGCLEGTSINYHINGTVWKKTPYHKNLIDGVAEIFQEDGTVLQRNNYVRGLKEGESIRYWNECQIASQEEYCEGLLAQGRYYNSDGECIAQVDDGNGVRAVFSKNCLAEFQEFHNGVLDGKVSVFDRYNRISKTFHMKKNFRQGEEIIFYDAPKFKKTLGPKVSINWFEGKIQGTVKTWYENGQPESQKEMNNNRKNGHSMVWYNDGSLMMIEDYAQDKLVKGEYYVKGENVSISDVFDGKGTATIFAPDGTFQRKVLYFDGKPLVEQ